MSSRGFRASIFSSSDDISPTQPPIYTLLPEKSTMLLAEVPSRLDTTSFQNPQVHWKTTAQPQDDGSDRDIVAPSPTWRDRKPSNLKSGSSLNVYVVYYRVYTQDGAVQSKCAIDSHDTSLGENSIGQEYLESHWYAFYAGRINANLVAPPHTAASIKRHLCKAEDVADYACTQLFGDTASSEPLDDKALVPILTGAGPGSTPNAPIALVVTTETRSQTISASSSPKTPNREQSYMKWMIDYLTISNSGAPHNVFIMVRPNYAPDAFRPATEETAATT